MMRSLRDSPVKLLLLEDSDFDAELIQERLTDIRPLPHIVRVLGHADYRAALERERFDLILSDYSLPGFDGFAALDIATEKTPETPFIFVSGVLGEEIAIDSLRNGATDYVLKQRLIRLPAAVSRAIREARERAERRAAEQQMKLLVAELSHRVKNTLATVMSITRRTAKSCMTVEDYERALISRLRALSDAHTLVFETSWRETDLDQVLERTLAPFRRDGERNITLVGPIVKLEPKTALTLSLIIHELATNAVRHGALSRDKGEVRAEWRTQPEESQRRVSFTWTETGGPATARPDKTGFGLNLIERSARYELDGQALLSYPATGLICELNFLAA
jgi:two-component sensor histidine kinase/CheY-like chemotaxis protein